MEPNDAADAVMLSHWTKPTRRAREFRFRGALTPAVLHWAITKFHYERGTRPRRILLHPAALQSYFEEDRSAEGSWHRRYRVTAWRPYRWWQRIANAFLGLLNRPPLQQVPLHTIPVLAMTDLIVDHETEHNVFRLE